MCIQVQYPDAQQTMMTDLTSIRRWAGFLQKTEIKFDMLSAVDELSKQVHLLCSTSIFNGHILCGAAGMYASHASAGLPVDVSDACRWCWNLTSGGKLESWML